MMVTTQITVAGNTQAQTADEQIKQQQLDATNQANQAIQANAQAAASAQAAAKKAEKENEKGSQIYQYASLLCGVTSAGLAAMSGPECPECMPASIAFAVFSAGASMQSDSHKKTANSACNTASQLEAQGSTCGQPSKTPNPASTITQNFDQNGNCIGNQQDCADITKAIPPGTNMKGVMTGLSTFASPKAPFKVNPDGSVTTKDGKKFTSGDFANENAMIAAGLSPADAKATFSAIEKMKKSINDDLEASINKIDKKNTPNAYADTSTSGGNKKNDGLLTNGALLSGKNPGDKDRALASAEGLVRNFNGESIGISDDDIFKMMSRRYKLKTSQDNFISP